MGLTEQIARSPSPASRGRRSALPARYAFLPCEAGKGHSAKRGGRVRPRSIRASVTTTSATPAAATSQLGRGASSRLKLASHTPGERDVADEGVP